MNISDRILKQRLENVYFLWGRGKTTIAAILRDRFDAVVYSTDDSRWPHMCQAHPDEQPYMCRDYEAEYGIDVVIWDDHTAPDETADAVAEIFGLSESFRNEALLST